MPADHRVISIEDFLRTDLTGTVDFDATRRAIAEMVESCNEAGIDHVLMDVREVSATDIDVSDIFSLVMHLLSLGTPGDFRMAIVNRPKDPIDRAKIFEQCAQEQGMSVAAFQDFEEALMWLNDDPRS